MLVCKIRYTTNIIQHTKVSILMTVCLFKMAYNVLQLGEVADLEALIFILALNFF